MTPAIFGLSGLTLTADERAFFRESDPAGYILFGRNIQDRSQVRALTDELRSIHGREHVLSLDAAPLAEAAAWIEHYRGFWEARLEALDAFVTGGAKRPQRRRAR